jgi:hypothetical protein
MSLQFPLRILAGKRAFGRIQDTGLRLNDFGLLMAAAGGSKFLMTGGLDAVLFRELARTRSDVDPLHCVGSSIGSFRMACLCCDDPGAALERLAEACIEIAGDASTQSAPASVVRALARAVLDGERPESIVEHPRFRLHLLSTRCHGLMASDRRATLLAGLGLVAAGNLLSRRTLALHFTRVVFHSRGERWPLRALSDLPTRHATMTRHNLHDVLDATAAVPLLVPGVTIEGAPAGVYRDSALLDYHPAFALDPTDKLVLCPHYYPHLTPGWFDRSFPFRRTRGEVLASTVIVTPTESFVARLPRGARPSRKATARLPRAERVREWRAVWSMGRELGDAFATLLASKQHAHRALAPLD